MPEPPTHTANLTFSLSIPADPEQTPWEIAIGASPSKNLIASILRAIALNLSPAATDAIEYLDDPNRRHP